ncbi:MAG TPA: hypothetical protein VM165_04330, partial [Planctomycetaceae bacterium]|nr:hypothetical protein [Planctomycetaceae bacterium]
MNFFPPFHLSNIALRLRDDPLNLLFIPQRLTASVFGRGPRFVVLAAGQLVLDDRFIGDLLAFDVQVQSVEEQIDRLRRQLQGDLPRIPVNLLEQLEGKGAPVGLAGFVELRVVHVERVATLGFVHQTAEQPIDHSLMAVRIRSHVAHPIQGDEQWAEGFRNG